MTAHTHMHTCTYIGARTRTTTIAHTHNRRISGTWRLGPCRANGSNSGCDNTLTRMPLLITDGTCECFTEVMTRTTSRQIGSQIVRQSDRRTNRRVVSHMNRQTVDEACWVIHLHAEGRRQRYQLWRIYEPCLAGRKDLISGAERAASLVTRYLQGACREASDDSQSSVNMLTNLSQQMSRLDCRKTTGHRQRHRRKSIAMCALNTVHDRGAVWQILHSTILYSVCTIYGTVHNPKTTTQAKHDTEIKRII